MKPLIPFKIRFVILISFFCLFFLLIWGYLFNLQVLKSSDLASKLRHNLFQNAIILRGDIRDRYGNLLVLDVIEYDIYNNVTDINKVAEEKIDELSEILKTRKEELLEKLHQRINTKMYSRISQDIRDKIKQLNISFIYFSPNLTRKYPHKYFASHILGFVNNDHKGQHGVEYSYESILTKPEDNKDSTLPFPKGTSIVLTLDSILQQYCENKLNETIKKSKAKKGAIIVLSPKTGEIYSFASYPDYDPNQFYKEKNIKNWAITDIYEPGSTFKIITISSALENNTITVDSTFFDPGYLEVSGRKIHNHEKTKPRTINLLNLFKHSSNVAAAQIGLTMKPEQFYTLIKNFMLGQKTNIDLPGESSGLLVEPQRWRKIDLATTAIGQGAISVTPIQIAAAVSAIANHGLWTQPHVLKGLWEPNYNLVIENPFMIIQNQVVTPETADFVSGLLKQSVKENLEIMAYIAGNVPGYEVAGKTGTAQKIKPEGKGYWTGHTIASFIGYFPADNPEILILVVIDNPQTEGRWGNTIAGPVFNEVAKITARRLLESR